jgi:hypothetical protein
MALPEIKQILALRGKRSRNKVSVGEPAEGSFITERPSLTNVRAMPMHLLWSKQLLNFLPNIHKFSTMDILAPITMKNAAKCDTQCELQNRESSDL